MDKLLKLLLKPEEVAVAIGVSRSRAYALISSGAIPSIRLEGGKNVRVRVEALYEWINRQTTTEAVAEG